jgi:protein-tyrosine-phosphatase
MKRQLKVKDAPGTTNGKHDSGIGPGSGANRTMGQLFRQAAVRVAKQVLPNSFTARFERLERKARPVYLKLQLMEMLAPTRVAGRKVPASARSVLAVCFGNIMRSPMVELMLKRAFAERGFEVARVCSAGLHAIPGRAAHPWAIQVSQELRIPLDGHRAKLLTAEMIEQADAVLAMDFENLAELLARYPDASDKIFMLSAYAEATQQYREIPDPYFGNVEETRRCYKTLQTCVRNLVSTLSEG